MLWLTFQDQIDDGAMPEMSGIELARQIVSVRPEIQVLPMSGYNEDQGINRGLRLSKLLQKPFTERPARH